MSSSFTHVNPPSKRNPARGRFFTDLAKGNNSNRVTAGKGILVSQTPTGVTVSINPNVVGSGTGGSSTTAYPCKITGGDAIYGYEVDLYTQGKNKPKTGTGMLSVLEVFCTSDLPVNSWVIGFPANIVVTGGNE